MKITVQAVPVNEILQDLSHKWNEPIMEDSGEQTINIPPHLGQGFVRGTSYKSGIGLIEYQCMFYEPYEIHFSIAEVHPLKFIFCVEGTIDHAFEHDEQMNTIQPYQNIIVSSSGTNGHLLKFKPGLKSHITSIEIVRSKFSNRENYNFVDLEPELKSLFKDSEAEQIFFYQGNYCVNAADTVQEINEKNHKGFLRSIFLESKIMELLVLQITQYQDDKINGPSSQILRKSDVEKVKRAGNIIEGDLSKNISVENLAKEVGTNVNKLQEGFKQVFGLTVNKYNQQVKLEAAREMLFKSEHNISEIVTLIGLNNRSYFSKIFKERYGVNPKYFQTSVSDFEEDTED